MPFVKKFLVDYLKTMKCCKCSQNTSLDPAAPGATQCSTCSHWECNSCDFS
ncbi:hypothetical protein BGZ57DRAFT_751433 [Hyaloscypha finlandica]|nr:hypothetical protein BGZ57DRAFT_751433 [Hyaloscypha finlandica]